MRQQHVEVAVGVEVGDLDARRAPVGMRRGVDDLRAEGRCLAVAGVDVGHDGLELLRQHRDEVLDAVLVDVHRHRVNRARPRIDDARDERRLGVVGGVVLEHREVADLAPAEGGDGDVERAVAVEVGQLHVGDARPAVERQGLVLARLRAAQPDDGAL